MFEFVGIFIFCLIIVQNVIIIDYVIYIGDLDFVLNVIVDVSYYYYFFLYVIILVKVFFFFSEILI